MKALVFTPHNPYPPRSGAQQRMLEVLIGLRELGVEVHLTGWVDFSENPWTPESRAWLEQNRLCRKISVFRGKLQPSLAARLWTRATRALPILKRRRAKPATLPDLTTPAMRKWFAGLMANDRPDYVVIHYVWFAPLLGSASERGQACTVLESQDLVTLNRAMSAKLDPLIRNGPVFKPYGVPEEALDLRFYDAADTRAQPSEFEAIGRFDITLAIAEDEAAQMRAHLPGSRVYTVATPVAPATVQSPHGKLALFPMGPHPFNLQGYAWLLRKVMPRILDSCPEFQAGVSGLTYYQLTLEYHPHVRILGFVSDPAELWSLGRMLISPNWGGTGQPIKTIEAMAAGLPPVILERFAHAAPIVHGENGFIARNEAEFARYCIELWRDPELCWTMGSRAIEAVRKHCSRDLFIGQLRDILAVRGSTATRTAT